jgi:putative colanic acid biosynthesis UDP-glucose lipid carrier transferase
MMDLLISLFVLATIFPLLLTVAVLVKASSPGPIFFKQRRYGLDGAEIGVWKFRTMAVLEDGAQIMQSIKSDMRHTPIGRFLRRTSLDELPQLFNVVQGTMSLVGPRPHVIAHNEEYRRLIRGYTYRLRVKPGLTGLAEINGLRGETGTLAQVQQRVAYDLEYLRTWSPWLDLKVLFFTVAHLLKDDRAY